MAQGCFQVRTRFLPLAKLPTAQEKTIWEKHMSFGHLQHGTDIARWYPDAQDSKLVFSTNFDFGFQNTTHQKGNGNIILHKNNVVCHNPSPIS